MFVFIKNYDAIILEYCTFTRFQMYNVIFKLATFNENLMALNCQRGKHFTFSSYAGTFFIWIVWIWHQDSIRPTRMDIRQVTTTIIISMIFCCDKDGACL